MKIEPSEGERKKKMKPVKTEPVKEEEKRKKKKNPMKTKPVRKKKKKKVSWLKSAIEWVPHVCLITKIPLSYELWKLKTAKSCFRSP